jgi:DNA polymerase
MAKLKRARSPHECEVGVGNILAEELRRQIRNPGCQDCELHATAKTVCLVGDGPVPCDVMLIGEAPGACEDEVGRPFVGRSGNVLDQALEQVGLPRSGIFITNTAKCRPPGNRTPRKAEIHACRKYLLRELEEVKPRFILLLGATALTLLEMEGVYKNRGCVFDFNGSRVMVTFHPAARGRRRRSTFHADIEAFARLVRGSMPLDPGTGCP